MACGKDTRAEAHTDHPRLTSFWTEFRAYALADNQLATKSAWDLEILSLELGELELALPEIGFDLTITGFEPQRMEISERTAPWPGRGVD